MSISEVERYIAFKTLLLIGEIFGNNLKITKNVVKWKVSLHEYIIGSDK